MNKKWFGGGFLGLAFSGCALTNTPVSSEKSGQEDESPSVDLGYTQVREDEYTGSIHTEKVDQEKYGPNVTLTDILQRTPGVFVQGNGANARAFIRGISSITGANEPLFVVDDVAIGNALKDLSFLNPNDIDKVTVLKDSSSTSLYGARGVNGVIIIRTKRS